MESKPMQSNCLAIFSSQLGLESSTIQKQDLQDYANKNNIKIESYIDSEKFKNLSLPEICEKLSRVQQSVVLCWRLDCFPSGLQNLDEFLDLIAVFSAKNISFISVNDQLDTDLAPNVFILSLRRAWKNFKKNRKVTNAKASLLKIKSRNTSFKAGRKKIRNDQLILSLRASGLSIREIAKKIKLSTTAVQRALKTSKIQVTSSERPLDL